MYVIDIPERGRINALNLCYDKQYKEQEKERKKRDEQYKEREEQRKKREEQIQEEQRKKIQNE